MAVQRGSLGIHFDSRGKNLAAKEHIPLLDGHGFQVQFDCLFNVRDRLFQGDALGPAALQFGAPRVETVLVLLDDDTRLTGHYDSSVAQTFQLPSPWIFGLVRVLRTALWN
jgi:hypothetical protein